jgi:hypothetical protein
MKFEKKDIVYLLLIILLIFIGYFGYNKLNNMTKKFDNYENTINALNDTISVSIKNGFTTYSKKTPEIYLDDLLNSEYFKTLSKDQQEYYNELKKIKGLIAASKAELEKHGELLAEINKDDNPGFIKSDTISFKLGSVLTFSEKDTTKHLQWKSNITLDTNIKFNFTYKYNFNILTTFERQKDKSIMVNYKINDPDLVVNNMQNFIIPPEQRASKFGRWYDKNKRLFTIVGGSVLFIGGGVLGYTVAK